MDRLDRVDIELIQFDRDIRPDTLDVRRFLHEVANGLNIIPHLTKLTTHHTVNLGERQPGQNQPIDSRESSFPRSIEPQSTFGVGLNNLLTRGGVQCWTLSRSHVYICIGGRGGRGILFSVGAEPPSPGS